MLSILRLFGALRNAPFERETLGLITARGDDRPCGGENPRPGNNSLVDGLFQFDIRVLRAFRAQIADRGEAGHQGRAQMIGRARDTHSQAFMRHLIVPTGFVVRVQQNVRMPLTSPGSSVSRAGRPLSRPLHRR